MSGIRYLQFIFSFLVGCSLAFGFKIIPFINCGYTQHETDEDGNVFILWILENLGKTVVLWYTCKKPNCGK